MDEDVLLGKLFTLPIRKETGATQERRQVLDRVADLPADIQNLLKQGKAQISDKELYAVIAFTGQTSFKAVDTSVAKKAGVTNLNNARYSKWFLVQAVGVLYAEPATGAADSAERFDDAMPAGMANGWFTISCDSKELVSEMSLECMANANLMPSNARFGVYELKNPKWIVPEKDISIDITLAAAITPATGKKSVAKVVLIGQEVRPF